MSQESMLGQPVTGMRPLDVPLNLLGVLGAIKGGQLGNQLVAMQNSKLLRQEQAIKNLADQAALLQTPEYREYVRDHPDSWKAAGLQGPAIPEPTSERVDENTTRMLVHPSLVTRAGVTPGMPADMPSATMTDAVARTLLNAAQARSLNRATTALETQPEGPPQQPGFTPTRVTSSPLRGREWQMEPNPVAPPQTNLPVSRVVTDSRGRATVTQEIPKAGGAGGSVQLKNREGKIQSMESVLIASLFDPKAAERGVYNLRPAVRQAGDMTKSFWSEKGGWQGAADYWLRDNFPSYQSWLQSSARALQSSKGTSPELREALNSVTSTMGFAATLAGALGDAANIADAEQVRLLNLLPKPGDPPSMIESKGRFMLNLLRQMREGLQANPNMTKADLRSFISRAAGIQLPTPRDAAQESQPVDFPDLTAPAQDQTPGIQPAAPTVTPTQGTRPATPTPPPSTAGRGVTSHDPRAVQEAADRLNRVRR